MGADPLSARLATVSKQPVHTQHGADGKQRKRMLAHAAANTAR